MGEILFVNLTNKTIKSIPLDLGIAKKFIGGSGYASMLLHDMLNPNVDPLDPDNLLLFITGPLTGTLAPSSGRHVVCGRSPLTGFWGESHAGGHFGARLKYSGFDGILIKGKSEQPVVLHINDGESEVISASHLWGETTGVTQDQLKKDLGRVETACIGPAGENLVKFAAVINGDRSAARCGLGAVMGSKNLKAISVQGSKKVSLAQSDTFMELAKESSKILGDALDMLRDQGTVMYVDIGLMFNDMPIKYFQEIEFEGDQINAVAMEEILTGRTACHSCPIACGRKVSVSDIGLENIAGPEYQTVAAFGSNIENSDLKSIVKINHMCNQFGMDTISCGSTIAFAIYLCDLGKADWGLKWGDSAKAIELVDAIANRNGLGEFLAEGSLRLGQKYNAEDHVIHVKGLEVANHDPRAFGGMTTVYAVGSRGASHLEGDMYSVDMGADVRELGIVSGDRLENEGKGITAAKSQSFRAFFDSIIMCHFAIVPPNRIIELLNLATGFSLTSDDILPIGSRAVTMKRFFNLKLGLKPEDDNLPPALLKPHADSVTEDFVPDVKQQLTEYYQYRKWDLESGRPTPKAIEELGLELGN
jgi:aldehyde:ferredoxin oxidoreductase